MLTSILKSTAKKALLGTTLCAAGMTLMASSASSQTRAARQFALSPGSQRVLYVIMSGSSQYGQQLVWNALYKIGPQRAEAQLAPLSVVPLNELQMRMQVLGWIMQMVPTEYHQAFVNGLFEATPQETQYADWIINGVAQSMNAQGGGPSNEDFLYAQRMNRLMTLMTFWNRPR